MSRIDELKQGEGQCRNVFNTLKRLMRDIDQLDNKQIAQLHFETWHVANKRAKAQENQQ